ncbi:MAG: hypothetical protein QNJ58_12660 [Desulfobacterales bacterium]|nr:hypothetical protein [Desulfobacterales bacterium]
MLISHNGKKPDVHSSAFVAPTATICGDVTIGPNCRVMHGASIVAEGGKIRIGEYRHLFSKTKNPDLQGKIF